MTIALILAGGTGLRMGAEIPKQFIKVLDKPVIVHTLEVFESHPEIDMIEVVSVSNYMDEVSDYSLKYNINKLKYVIEGGETCQQSIYKGILGLKNICSSDDIVMIAMSVAPLISCDIITDSIRICKKYGNAIAATNSIYSFSTIKDGYWADNYIYKEDHVTLNMPWTFPYGKLYWAYKNAYDNGVGTDIRSYTTSLMINLGEKLYFSKDSQANKLKLTTFDDMDMLEGYLLINEIRKGNVNIIEKVRKQKNDLGR